MRAVGWSARRQGELRGWVAVAWGALGVLTVLALWELYKFLGPAEGVVIGAVPGSAGSGVMILPRTHDRAMPHVWDMVARLFAPTSGGDTPPLWVSVAGAALVTLGIASIGWLIGGLRLMPPLELQAGGYTIVPTPFWGGLLFPTIVFGILYAWPAIGRRFFDGPGTDSIFDFVSGTDKIHLTEMDANRNVLGNQNFTFIGTAAFGNVAGELRSYTDSTGSHVAGDLNGDGVADFTIHTSSLAVAGDFFL